MKFINFDDEENAWKLDTRRKIIMGNLVAAYGPKTMRVFTGLLHGSPKMHNALRGQGSDVVPPIHLSIATEPGTDRLMHAFAHVLDPQRERMAQPDREPIYSRLGLIAHLQLEHHTMIAEGQIPEQSNYEAVSFAAGMGAIDAGIEVQVWAGEHFGQHMPVYGCSNRLANRLTLRDGRSVTQADLNDMAALKGLIRPETTLLYGEIMANPTLRLMDIPRMAQVIEDSNKKGLTKRPIQLGIDSTFVTPVGFRALDHGATWVLHSGSKYLGGFMQHVSGIIVAPKDMVYGTQDDGLLSYRDQKGSVLDMFAAHQILTTGLSTLIPRVFLMNASANVVAEFLAENENIAKAVYPGLADYEDRELADVLLKDYDGNRFNGSMIYFEVEGKTLEESKERGYRLMKFLEKKGYATTVAVSLGAVVTLVEHPASMTHGSYTVDQLAASGISPGGIRISVGLESPDDIIADLREGLKFAYSDRTIESLDEKTSTVDTSV